MESLKNIPAVLLVGGKGTRLQSVVSSKPKPLAPVGEKSFLHLLIRQLRSQGIRELVMCTGYLADQIENELGDGSSLDVAIRYSKENEPLGTAGALKLAEPLLAGRSDFLVMNGDSFLEMDIPRFVEFHHLKNGLFSVAVRRVENAARYGTVEIDKQYRITGFKEKTGSTASGLINGGVYIFKSSLLVNIPTGPSSLERDILPNLLDRRAFALEQQGMFIDIGTPEDYARAQELCESMYRAATL
jgi:D-glycero-alpha-D-manno-heptose 1-phosphate guanylyltransferase